MALFKFLRFKLRRRSKRVDSAEDPKTGSDQSVDPFTKKKEMNPNSNMAAIKRFSWEEINRIARNFSSVIGEGGFSTVYLAHLPNNTLGALKIQRKSDRLSRLFKQELEILLQLRHENIVKLFGYCDEQDEGALLFEYVSNGSLHDKLHDDDNGSRRHSLLSWKTRMSIAFQLAQAIDYLHSNCALQIVHGDIKSSNVLLDENLRCKLCDFGFAKMGFSSTVLPSSMSPLMGSPGYMDPHYLRTGIASKKNDVYSFGVIILELITGMEAFCSDKEKLLTSIAGPLLRLQKEDANKMADFVDPRLSGNYPVDEVMVMASIAAQCLQHQPSLRPSMVNVIGLMKEEIIVH